MIANRQQANSVPPWQAKAWAVGQELKELEDAVGTYFAFTATG
jgi:hypothetical protein